MHDEYDANWQDEQDMLEHLHHHHEEQDRMEVVVAEALANPFASSLIETVKAAIDRFGGDVAAMLTPALNPLAAF